jgi:excisionase family DNA binding protein
MTVWKECLPKGATLLYKAIKWNMNMSIRKAKGVTLDPLEPEPATTLASVQMTSVKSESATDMKLDSLRMTSVKKAAEVFGVSVTTIWNWIASGRLKAVKVGGRRLIALREMRRVLGEAK